MNILPTKRTFIFSVLLVIGFTQATLLASSRVLVDEIVARVNDVNICRSDLDERQFLLGGGCRTVEQCVQDELMYQKAATYGAVMSEDDLEKRMVALREGYGFGYRSQGEFEASLRKSGLSLKRAREQVKRSGAVVALENAMLPKSALVSRQDVEVYCAQHPQEKDEEYLLAFATVPRNSLNLADELPEDTDLEWTQLDGWIKRSDLADSMKFVMNMKEGEVSKPALKDSTCFVYRLEKKAGKRLLSVDERYSEVEEILLTVRKAEKEAEIKQRFRDEASVVYLASK